jgi:hypothetical protein
LAPISADEKRFLSVHLRYLAVSSPEFGKFPYIAALP